MNNIDRRMPAQLSLRDFRYSIWSIKYLLDHLQAMNNDLSASLGNLVKFAIQFPFYGLTKSIETGEMLLFQAHVELIALIL